MKGSASHLEKTKRLLGWIGAFCLLLIIPVKALRWISESSASTTIVGISPSVLGPAGLLFLLLSSSGRLSRLTLLQTSLLVTAIALGLEFAQLLPRPGILSNVHYTFDWLDALASLVSVWLGYIVVRLITHNKE